MNNIISIKPKHQILLFIVLLIIALLIIYFDSEHTKDRIQEQFSIIEKAFSKVEGEDSRSVPKIIHEKNKVFYQNCTVIIEDLSYERTFNSSAIARLIINKRSKFSEVSVQFNDYELTFPQKNMAQVNVEADLQGILKGGKVINSLYAIECILKLVMVDDWVFKTITVKKVRDY